MQALKARVVNGCVDGYWFVLGQQQKKPVEIVRVSTLALTPEKWLNLAKWL